MRYLSASQTADLLPYRQASEAIAAVLRGWDRGEVTAVPRAVMRLPSSGSLLSMSATSGRLGVTKIVTVHPENTRVNLPTVQGDVLVFDATNGRRLLMLDGQTVTERRTAALSLLAVQTLAPDLRGPLLVVGAGAQGRSHVEAFQAGLGVDRVYLCGRGEDKMRRLAEYAHELGLEVHCVDQASDALEHVNLVVTATTSRTPVLPAELPEDLFVAAVGTFQPTAAEIPSAAFSNSHVVVDTLESAMEEAGDVIGAVAAGNLTWADVIPLGRALERVQHRSRRVIFKSVGHAILDLAAAELALKMYESNGQQ